MFQEFSSLFLELEAEPIKKGQRGFKLPTRAERLKVQASNMAKLRKTTGFQKEWITVRKFQDKLNRHLGVSLKITNELRDIVHNLVMLFAFSVLENVLKDFRDKGHFSEKSDLLKRLMKSSQKALSWRNFKLVNEGREQRNNIAHNKKIISRKECWDFIDAIETELVSWGVIRKP